MFKMIDLGEGSGEEVDLMPERRRPARRGRRSLKGMKIAGAAILVFGMIGLAFALAVPSVVPGENQVLCCCYLIIRR